MIKYIFIISIILAINTSHAGDEVIVYNWSNYIAKGVLEDFTKETGITVKYSTYDSNAVMFAKLEILGGKGYDVLVPSTNLVEKMHKESLLQEIDKKLIDNFKHLDKVFLNKPYDPNNKYSIPYLWGNTGILINSDKLESKKIKYWRNLWDEKFKNKILLLDDMRAAFHMAFKINGHSTNSRDKEEIKQAYELLYPLMRNIKKISSDQPETEFIKNNVIIGSIWNGDAARTQLNKPNFKYIYPREGALFWMDSFVIPIYAPNKHNAHVFINYMLRPDIAKRTTEDLYYPSANIAAKELLSLEMKNNSTLFPPKNLLKELEFHRDVGESLKIYKMYWDKLKLNQ
jgi:spermidine/putrescine transport system substrate-binding protein